MANSPILNRMTGTATTTPLHHRRVRTGFFLACLYGIVGLTSIMFVPSNPVLHLSTLVLVPIVLTLVATGRLADAFTLTWINEIFFGGAGRWIEVGPISGRWILLLTLLIIFLFITTSQKLLSNKPRRNKNPLKRPHFSTIIMIYGGLFPLWLVFYSVVFQGTQFWTALADVNFLFVLLAYFPLRCLLNRNFDIFRGWITGGIFMIGGVFILIAFLHSHLAGFIFDALAGSQVRLGRTVSGINRAALLIQVFLFLGIFIGSLYTLDKREKKLTRISGLALFFISITPFVLFFLRGPLMSFIIVTIIFLLASFKHNKAHLISIRLWVALLILALCVFVFYFFFLPEAIEKFTINEGGITTFVTERRLNDSAHMLKAFLQKPFLGYGVGVPLDGKLDFELQYNMLLYRLGAINFVVLIIPILWLFMEPFRILRKERSILYHRNGKFTFVVLLSVLATLIAGIMNPYLTAIYMPFLIILYLSCKEIVFMRGRMYNKK